MQDTFYDVVDALEEQSIESTLQTLFKQNVPELTEQVGIEQRVAF